MKRPISPSPNPKLTAADLDRSLNVEQDTILPSSGFAESVMTAMQHEASAPAPIPFPWRRAVPGLFAAAVVLVALIAGVILVVSSAPAATPVQASTAGVLSSQLAWLVHASSAATLPDAIWIGSSLALIFACFLVCRRLIFVR